MKSTGIVRRVDELGRIVLPKELREKMEINSQDALEIFTENQCIILRKYVMADIFTGETEDLIEFEGKKVSRSSIREMAKIAGIPLAEEA